jgi:hypothetical protein
MKGKAYLINLLFSFTVLFGCSTTGGQITSFEDLTTESKKEGFWKIPQYRVISIPGLLPFASVGGVHFYKAKRKPSSAIGLSYSASSYVIETTIESTCDEECMVDVRDKILDVKNAASNLIEDKINLTLLRANQAGSGAEDAEKHKLHEMLDSATDKYQTARTDLDEKHREAVKSIRNNGVIVFRWNTNTKKSGWFGLGNILGGSKEKDETQSGFGLISGLKVSTLYVGDDIKTDWELLNTKSRYSNRFEVTTYAMQVQRIMYMSEQDLSSSLSANLKASYSQLANISDTIKNLDNIQIQAALSKVSNLSNIGVIGNSVRTSVDVDWKTLNQKSKLDTHNGLHTFFAVKSDLTDILDMLAKIRHLKIDY